MQIPPSSNLIAALSALTPATRPAITQPAPAKASFTPTVSGAAGKPVAAPTGAPGAAAPSAGRATVPAASAAATGNDTGASAPRRHSPLGRIVDIRV